MLTFLHIFLIVWILFLLYNFWWKRRGLPPGPIPLPFFGNILEIQKHVPPYDLYKRWEARYGPIFTVWFGEKPVIFVADFDALRETFNGREANAYTGRDFLREMHIAHPAIKGVYGVLRTEGEEWATLRYFSLKTLRNLGMGRSALEAKILHDFDLFVEELMPEIEANKLTGEGVLLKPLIDKMAGSLINQILFSESFHKGNFHQLNKIKETMSNFRKLIASGTGRLLAEMTWLRFIPFTPFPACWQPIEDGISTVYDFLDNQISRKMKERESKQKGVSIGDGDEETKKDGDEDQEMSPSEDLVDAFLLEMEKNSEDENASKIYTLNHLRGLCFDLFVAGQETTATTLGFLILYMILDQRSQGRMHRELDNFIRTKRKSLNSDEESVNLPNKHYINITWADRQHLPFTQAIINETQRMVNLLPLSFPNRLTRDQLVPGGFLLPEKICIIPQISNVLYDEKYFPNHERFLPERFLDDEGNLKRCDQLVAFSVGRRSCLGESFAKMELFLFTANFFHRFWVYPSDPLNPPSTQKVYEMIAQYIPYRCRIVQKVQEVGEKLPPVN